MKTTNILQLLKPKALIAYIYEDATVRQAIEKMRRSGFTAVPVINRNGEYVKAIAEGDFLWFMMTHDTANLSKLENYKVSDIPKRVVCEPVYVYSTIEDLFKLSMNQNFVPVVDDRSVFIGIVTRKDILQVCYEKLKDSEAFLSVHEYEREDI